MYVPYGLGGAIESYKRTRKYPSMVQTATNLARKMIKLQMPKVGSIRKIRNQYKSVDKDTKMFANRGTQTKRSRKVYVTQGRSAKRIPKGKKVRGDYFARNGSVLKYESGNVVSDSNCVYIGFTTNPIGMTNRAVCRAVVKQLMQQVGADVIRWDEAWPFSTDMGLFVDFLTDPTDATLNSNYTSIPHNTTFSELANIINDACSGIMVSAQGALIQRIKLFENYGTPGDRCIAQIWANRFYVDLESHGDIAIQNRSLGADGSAQTTDISNNPVIGRTYTGYGNYFGVRVSTNASVLSPFMGSFGEPSFGVSSAENNSPVTRKPIDAKDLRGCKTSSPVTVEPGAIRKGYLTFKKSFNLQKYWSQVALTIKQSQTEPKGVVSRLGKIYMIGVEKLLNDRVSEGVVSLSYECNLTMKCAGRYSKGVDSITIIQEV